MCIFIKAIVCHVKQLLQHKEKLSNNVAFGNGDIFPLMSFSSISLYSLSNCLLLQRLWARTIGLTSGSVCCWSKAELGIGPSLFIMSSATFMENCRPLLSLREAPSTHVTDQEELPATRNHESGSMGVSRSTKSLTWPISGTQPQVIPLSQAMPAGMTVSWVLLVSFNQCAHWLSEPALATIPTHGSSLSTSLTSGSPLA